MLALTPCEFSDVAPMAVVWRGIVVLGAALTLGAALCFHAAAEPAKPPAAPQKTEPGKAKFEDIPEIVFYVAKGDSNACGLGCDQWIAADGKIDTGAPERLRRMLAKLGKRRLLLRQGLSGVEARRAGAHVGIRHRCVDVQFRLCLRPDRRHGASRAALGQAWDSLPR